MATINPRKLPQALEAFFRDELVPLATKFKQQRGPFFLLAADASVPTYYITRAKTRMDKADFERAGTDSPATLAADLTRLWQSAETPELAPLAPSLAQIAQAAREVEKEQEGDMSPFVYAMY
jgi:hypothetical protein